MRKLGTRGDTIVEVLICLAILGLAITSAYGIANRSQVGIRRSQERAEATKLAEMQVERIRYGTTSLGRSYTSGCVDISLNTTSGANCVVDGIYTMSVSQNTGTYTVNVTWDGLGGGQEQLSVRYRPLQ